MNPTVKELYSYYDSMIPKELSAPWDNDGVMICPNENKEVKKVLSCLDVTNEVVDYAVNNEIDLIVSHHPIIFHPIKQISNEKMVKLIKNDISVFSFHTRLDAVDGGVNDNLADILGLQETSPFADGFGRIGHLECVNDIDIFIDNVKNKLGCDYLITKSKNDIAHIVAIVSGAGGEFFSEARELGADTFISGEISHHEFIDGYESGLNMIMAGHYETESHIASVLLKMLNDRYPLINGINFENINK